MPQRLPVVRMFNLGLLEEIHGIKHVWRGGLEIKVKMRGLDYTLDLGISKGKRRTELLRGKKGFEYVEALAVVLFGATGQTFDSVQHLKDKCTFWFPTGY